MSRAQQVGVFLVCLLAAWPCQWTRANEIAVGGSSQPAGLLLCEPFDYPVGARLDSSVAVTGSGFAGQWLETSFDEESHVEAGSLAAPAGYARQPSSNRIGMPAGQGRSFAKAAPLPANAASLGSSSFFFSFLYRKGPDGDMDVWFSLASGPIVYHVGLDYVSETSAIYRMTLQGAGNDSQWGWADVYDGDDYLVVGKATNDPSGDDSIELLIYDAAVDVVPASEPNAFLDTLSGIEIGTPSIGSICVQINGDARFDELMVGTTWESVIGVPEPATLSLIGLGFWLLAIPRRRRKQAGTGDALGFRRRGA